MTFLVPYDGSPLARTALERARALAEPTTRLVAATVVPRDRQYAIERGWIDPGEAFDPEGIEHRLSREVADIAPEAEFRCLFVRQTASSGTVATQLRNVAEEVGPSVVFLGSENVGSIATPVGSIGTNVATRVPYDIYLVQSAE